MRRLNNHTSPVPLHNTFRSDINHGELRCVEEATVINFMHSNNSVTSVDF